MANKLLIEPEILRIEYKPEIKCECIDKETLKIIKTALVTSSLRLEYTAKKLTKEKDKAPLRIEAIKTHVILNELNKIPECKK